MLRNSGAALLALGSLAVTSVEPGSAGGAVSVRSRASDPGTAAATQDPDLAPLRKLLDQADKARDAKDHAGARARIAAAIEEALAVLAEREDEEALELLNRLATFAYESGELRAAEKAQRKLLEVRSRTLPEDHAEVQRARVSLSNTILALGDLRGARALDEQVLEVRSRTLPEDHIEMQVARGNLAITMKALDDLQGSRALLEQVLEVRSRTLPDGHPDLQMVRLNLAATLNLLGDLQAARALEEQVLEVCSRTLPEDHPELQWARGNLAITIRELGDLEDARALTEQVVEVFSRTLPEDHPDLQKARLNLALAMKELGDLEGARALIEQVLEVSSRNLPEYHPDLQRTRLSLALTLKALGDLEGARALEEQVLEIRSRTLREEDPELHAARNNLAWTLAHQLARTAREPGGSPEKEAERSIEWQRCAELVEVMCRAQTSAARASLLETSAREAEARSERPSSWLHTSLSFAGGMGVFEPMVELERACFVLSETTRGAALGAAALMRRAAGTPRYSELREELRARSEELAALVQKGTTSEGFREALARREAVERDLAALARELSGGKAMGLDFELDPLAQELAQRDAVVAYRRYKRWSLARPATVDAGASQGPASVELPIQVSVDHLCAFVVRARRGPSPAEDGSAVLTLLELGPIEPIEQAVRAWREAIGAGLERGRAVPAGHVDAARSRGEELRELVLDPLEEELAGAERVVLALDDVLHLVPIEALPIDAAADDPDASDAPLSLGDGRRFETRCTLTELLAPTAPPAGAQTLVSLGGASFNSEPLGTSAEDAGALETAKPDGAKGAPILRGGAWERGFSPLTYTGLEAREVAALHAEAFGESARSVVLEKRKASRAALEELAPKARWLHVATHGWFASESIRSWKDEEPLDRHSGLGLRLSGEEQVKGMSPMLLCGLALAGANLPENELGRVPGLITAEEIAALDLSNCELAVLSACDTNVGERRAGQGVASLQKALQMAGARTVITSLWKVSDEATRELMTDFYRRIWVEKKPKAQALWEAKRRLREANDESGRPRYTTRDWAAWVLTGEPR